MLEVVSHAPNAKRSEVSKALKLYELRRSTLIDILRDGSQHMRPPRLHRLDKADLVNAVERALMSANFQHQYSRLLESYVLCWEPPSILRVLKPVGYNGEWTWSWPSEQDGFIVQTGTKRSTGRVCLHIIWGDKVVHTSYHEAEVWAGHCGGRLLIDPAIVKLKADAATEEVGAPVNDN